MSINPLYTAHATSLGGRHGHTESSDGLVKADLTIPKAMGGPGKAGATTPEDLFAAGYAACFGSACDYMGTQLKLKPSSVKIEAAVSIGGFSDGKPGFGLKVDLIATIGGLSQADAEKVVAAGHAICPYSNAVKGNVDVGIKVVAA